MGLIWGGTKIEGVVLDPEAHETFRKRIPTERDQGYEAILKKIQGLYGELEESIQGKEHSFGIGTPGAISHQTGCVKNSNTVCLIGKPLKSDLEKILKHACVMENDANCFALAEALLGAGKGKKSVFGVIMGTGCGGGIVHDGKIISGLQAIAGEWGHMSMDPKGPLCYCGARGCVETLISGHGLENQYAEKFGEALALKTIVANYRQKDSTAVSFMNCFFKDFGRALANLINIIDPDVIVLGGGVSNIDELYHEGIHEVEKAVFSDSLETPILKHTLGDSAGVYGAALIGASH